MKPEPSKPKTEFILPPTLPKVPHMMGDAADDAYTAAFNARTACLAKYDPDNTQLGEDITRYNQDNSNWNRIKDQMTEPDKTNCFNALSGAYGSLSTENTKITNAYGHIAAGDTAMTDGDNAGNQMQKIMFYNNAKAHYDTGKAACVDAEAAHGAFSGFVATAEEIEGHWG